VDFLALELMPRITRAQSMDALSSMATVAGYKAVLIAAGALPRMFPMLMTAAGTVTPARVLVIGAGVAGLQVIASARRLGAMSPGFAGIDNELYYNELYYLDKTLMLFGDAKAFVTAILKELPVRAGA
jgi:alanine dehydrogenase